MKGLNNTHDYYINRFIKLNCSSDLLGYKLFPNAKEITETFACLGSVEKVIHGFDETFAKNNKEVTACVIGDGVVPRTAAFLAHITAWNCVSIDPMMRRIDWNEIKRLKVYDTKVEQVPSQEAENVLIFMPHSHAPIESCWNLYPNTKKKWLIKMPCCTHDRLNRPMLSYKDFGIWSEKRSMEIYCNYIDLITHNLI